MAKQPKSPVQPEDAPNPQQQNQRRQERGQVPDEDIPPTPSEREGRPEADDTDTEAPGSDSDRRQSSKGNTLPDREQNPDAKSDGTDGKRNEQNQRGGKGRDTLHVPSRMNRRS